MPTLPTTCKAEFGFHVPIPTLPFMTVNAPAGAVVPMPTLPMLVMLTKTVPAEFWAWKRSAV